MPHPNYTQSEVETAMILWELAYTCEDLAPRTAAALRALREEIGTSALRNHIANLVEICEEEWEKAREAGTEIVGYENGHCVAFLNAQNFADRLRDPPSLDSSATPSIN